MADVTISSLPLGTPSGSLFVPISDSASTFKAPLSDIQVNYNSLVNAPAIPQGVPTGAVFHLATSTVPTGYLKCNGDTIPNGSGTVQGVTTNFSALYAVLGNTYGALGRLPDLRGEFIRGFDDGRNVDAGRIMGSSQTDELKSHTHLGAVYRYYIGAPGGHGWISGTNQTTETAATGGTETRPRNVALMPVIKY